jgi:hypothetical protein
VADPCIGDLYQVDEFSLTGAEYLVRALTAQPREILPGLGQYRTCPHTGTS